MITLNTLRTLAKRLPGVREELSYGTPGFKVGKKLLARWHQTEPAIVLVLGAVEEQSELLASDSETFYITDHYVGYPAVLVRLTIPKEVLFGLLEHSWRRVARQADIRDYEARRSRSDSSNQT